MPATKQAANYLTLKLKWLDTLLHREILRLRARYQLSLDEFRGLYISDEQVNTFIDQSSDLQDSNSSIEGVTKCADALRRAANVCAAADKNWQHVVTEFSLCATEQDLLLIALAPELDLKYETLYAYLNNDVTRKWPTNDLALRLLAIDERRTELRCYLTDEGTLLSTGLLQPISQTPDRPSWLARGFSISPDVSQWLIGIPPEDGLTIEESATNVGLHDLPVSSELRSVLQRVARFDDENGSMLFTVFTGREGSGRVTAAQAICDELKIDLVRLDLAALRASSDSVESLVRKLVLRKRLRNAGLYVERLDLLFDQLRQPLPEARKLINLLSHCEPPVFIASDPETQLQDLLVGQRAVVVHFEDPDYQLRLQIWKKALNRFDHAIDNSTIEALADSFVLNPSQIVAAVTSARDAQQLTADSVLSSESVFAAARAQSNQSLRHLAVKMKTIHTWDDLVLPRATLQHLKEIAAAIKHRHIVYSSWGFESRIAAGLGLKALFAGGSGTGKTMAAGVIARELGLDIYKIDLSGIVSKYIGETEKNLDRIFRAAQSSNAILFFDEADALFGKRSEVKDAHDRYANIEVAYLLQKIEEYQGVVILASNLSRNIDDAFSRRMHYVIEFALPDEHHRERLWCGMFPSAVPLAKDVDIKFLAKQFAITGGDIRNVALDAAFMAAQDGKVVTMKQLIRAMARQLTKQGRIPSPGEFKQYHEFITQN